MSTSEFPTSVSELAHSQGSDEVANALGVVPTQGLSSEEAARRLAHDGPNALPEAEATPAWKRFLDQFRSGLILVLVGAAVVAAAVGHVKDALIIAVVLILNAILGFVQESKAEAGLAALTSMLASTAVRRDGAAIDIAAADVVRGDVLLLESGDRIAADARVLSAHQAEVDESALTGESVPVAKSTDPAAPDAAVADRHGMIYRTTLVAQGRIEAIVTAIGPETELGKVATLLQANERKATPLQEQLDRLGQRLAFVALGAVLAYGALSLARPQHWRHGTAGGRPGSGGDPRRAPRRGHRRACGGHIADGQARRNRAAAGIGRDAGRDIGHLLRQDGHPDAQRDDRPAPGAARRASLQRERRGLRHRRDVGAERTCRALELCRGS